MPDISISQLQEATQIDQNVDLFLLSQNGVAKKLTGATLKVKLAQWLDGHGGISDISYSPPPSIGTDIDGTLTITLADGTEEEFTIRNGRGIMSIVTYYALSSSPSVAPTVWVTTPPSLTDINRYLWSYSRTTFNDGTYIDTAKAVIGVWGDKGQKGDTGDKGDQGNGIVSISKIGTSGLIDTYTVTFDNGDTTSFTITNGSSIQSITKTSTSGLVDTYTVTLTNGSTTSFSVTNAKSIESIAQIEGTHAPGTQDKYQITFNDGDTFDFVVMNGNDGSGAVASVSGISPGVGGDVKQVSTGVGAPDSSTMGNTNELYVNTADGKLYVCLGESEGAFQWISAGSVTVDSSLSSSSVNPVQNKVIYSSIQSINTNVDNAAQTANAGGVTGIKLFLMGAQSQANKQTPSSNVNCYIGTDNELYSGGEVVAKASSLLAHANAANPHSGSASTAALNEAINSINSLAAKLASILPSEWTAKAYSTGEVVMKGDLMYQAVADTGTSWNPAQWTQVRIGNAAVLTYEEV